MRYARNHGFGLFTIALALALILGGPAEARRGGSFGSRGSRTYSAPSPSAVSPGYVPPVQRSMTPNLGSPGFQQPLPGRRPGFGGGLAGGLLGGVLAGGLIGAMMGHGWGGGGGGMSLLLQLLILGAVVWAAMRIFRRRNPAFAEQPQAASSFLGGAPMFGAGARPLDPAQTNAAAGLTGSDQQTFEQLLVDLQEAFGKEDYARLRQITTPEVMSYLAEEMSQNATQNRRNDVSAVRLLQADVSEAWSESDIRYATVALRYESVDVMRDRTTGAVVQGDPLHPTQTTELWTFLRRSGGPWLVSAVQET